jgi:hypothetical protein
MVTKATLAICLVAAVATAVLGCTSTAGLTPGDAAVVLWVVGPYLLLASLAWWQRARPAASVVLLIIVVALSAWGIYVYGEDSYRYHTEPRYRMVQRVAVFAVPLAQWLIAMVAWMILLAVWLLSRRTESESYG